MELRHLRYFAAVADLLSFRRAAERLHLTRPALSKQVKELEAELGVRLLDRTTAKVSLTPAGHVYLREVNDILGRADRAAELARDAAAGKRGLLVIGQPGVLGATFLAPALAMFRERFPQVEVMLQELPDHQHLAAVESGQIQVGFAPAARVAERPALEGSVVLRLRVGVALSRQHPYAERSTLPLRELVGQPMLCIGEGRLSEHAQYVQERFAAIGAPPPRIRLVPGIPSLMTMVASGHGISLVPESVASHTAGDVVIVPIQRSSGPFDFAMLAVWRRREDSQLVQNFVHALRRLARQTAV